MHKFTENLLQSPVKIVLLIELHFRETSNDT